MRSLWRRRFSWPKTHLPGASPRCHPNCAAPSAAWKRLTIKREPLDAAIRPTRAAARAVIFDLIEGRYDLDRLHSSLGYRGPADYETAHAA